MQKGMLMRPQGLRTGRLHPPPCYATVSNTVWLSISKFFRLLSWLISS